MNSADILRMFNSGFGDLAADEVDLYPEALRAEIDALNDEIYPHLNNGVYRAGFATTQEAYDKPLKRFLPCWMRWSGALKAAAPSCSARNWWKSTSACSSP